MNIQEYFKTARRLMADQSYEKLGQLTLDKPEYFNWAEAIFYELNVREYGDDLSLIHI